jgi:hypothetical protein
MSLKRRILVKRRNLTSKKVEKKRVSKKILKPLKARSSP